MLAEDDPDDIDFEPDGVAGNRTRMKDDDWEIEDSEIEVETLESEREVDVSSDDDSYYRKKPWGGQRVRSGGNAKASKGQRSLLYAESEESEEVDEGKNKKSQKLSVSRRF